MLEEFILDLIVDWQEKRREIKIASEKKGLSVTEITQGCPRRKKILNKHNWLNLKPDPRIVLGRLVHEAVQRHLEERGAETELVLKREVEDDLVIIGIPDAVTEDEKIIEIKFTVSKEPFREQVPIVHHYWQTKMYLWLAQEYRDEGYDIEEGYIWYLSPDQFAEFKVTLDKEDEKEIKNLINQYLRGERPNWLEWICKTCPISKLCSHLRSTIDACKVP